MDIDPTISPSAPETILSQKSLNSEDQKSEKLKKSNQTINSFANRNRVDPSYWFLARVLVLVLLPRPNRYWFLGLVLVLVPLPRPNRQRWIAAALPDQQHSQINSLARPAAYPDQQSSQISSIARSTTLPDQQHRQISSLA